MSVLLAALRVGPVQFDEPVWLAALPVLVAATVWMARRSLSGLGTRARRVALALRVVVLALVVGALARPQWRREAVDLAVTAILDSSRSVPPVRQRAAEEYLERARTAEGVREGDRLGVVSVAETALAQQLPTRAVRRVERANVGRDLGTDLAAGVRLSLAIRPEDAAYRLLVVTDGNETSGSLLEAAEAARAARVPIDVLPVRFRAESEVAVEQLSAPATARQGEAVNVRVVLSATRAAQGRLSLLLNDEAVDLDPGSASSGMVVAVSPGLNPFTVPVTIPRSGAARLRAVFEPLEGAGGRGDTVIENNEALAVTFVTSEGRVLLVTPSSKVEGLRPLVGALEASRLAVEVVPPERLPASLAELSAYEGIILADVASYEFSQKSQEELRDYVHETGGGLVMVGGPDAFGAGGWIGSPLEDALPVRMDPPQKRQMPRGALMVISHSVEMPDGVTWGKRTAQAAVEALSRLDLAGLVEYRGMGSGATLVHPLSEVGDGSAIRRSINNLQFGDMFDYSSAFQVCINALVNAEAGAKHIILITDGDAQPPTTRQIQEMVKNRITVSTVGVFPHTPGDLRKLEELARATRGRHYEVVDQGGLGQIVQIFIKEAQTVKRALIWEGTPFAPGFAGASAENMRGFTGFPPVSGYVVTGEREGLAQVTLRGKENDPIAAQWQHGLGRVFVFTSDATSRWNAAWVGWPGYRAFWEQAVRWAMRPGGNPNVRVTTQREGDRARIIVDALDAEGERLNFAQFRGRLAGPGGGGADVELRQVGPGRYEGEVEVAEAGSYVLGLRYASAGAGGRVVEGSVQAAISKPFADEFKATSDNLPLLEQVAAMTGGRVLSGDPGRDEVFSREGLRFPVALTPIWPVLALMGVAAFLADVAARRVRVDVGAIRRAVLSRSRGRKAADVGGLRAAREQARRSMEARAKAAGEAGGPATAGVKFEATAEELRSASSPVEAAAPAAKGGAERSGARGEAGKDDGEGAKDGISRLKQAKRRAQDELKDDQ